MIRLVVLFALVTGAALHASAAETQLALDERVPLPLDDAEHARIVGRLQALGVSASVDKRGRIDEIRQWEELDERGLTEFMKVCAELDSLAVLRLNNVPLTPDVRLGLLKLEHLRTLELQNVTIDSDFIELLGLLPKLSELSINWSHFKDRPGPAFAELRSLKSLQMINSDRLGPDFIVALAQLEKLETFEIGDSKMSDGDLALLPLLTNIKRLRLEGTGATDSVFEIVAKLPQLDLLSLRRTKVTEEEVRRFRQAHPRIDLQSDFKD